MERIEVEELREVELREVWPHEASHFTPWLALNLHHLSDGLGLDLELVGTKVGVGPFAADILAIDTATGRRVVIENLLEVTDHDHLGKLITYSSVLNADYAVLVARRFRPEHRTALTWLNSRFESDSGFFAVEVRAVRIGDSAAAAQIDVVVEPDDWARRGDETVRAELSDTQVRYQRWWGEFLPAMGEEFPGWTNASTPPRANWMNFPTGRSGIRYGLSFSWPDAATGWRMRAEVYADDSSVWWPLLVAHRDTVTAALGDAVSWEEMPDAKGCRVALYLPGADPAMESEWPDYRRWAFDRLAELRATFAPIIDAAPR